MPETAKIYSVSELTRLIRNALEDRFGNTLVEGEISNYFASSAGHIYFTLKDAGSQIKAVFFKGSQRGQTVSLKDGLKVRILGDVSVYEKGGNYQITARTIELAGKGDLHAQFEALKLKLHQEGLFDESRKRPLPFLPQRLAVVTSPRGAAIRDFLNVIARRYPNMHIVIFPVLVQGQGAASEIAAAISAANARAGFDVIVVTRGGGSLEDLWCFNEEVVARAIARSALPVVSAVGHEVDFTMCDFVADFRAATPSAAAELLVGRKEDFEKQLQGLQRSLARALQSHVLGLKHDLLRVASHPALREPRVLVQQYQQRMDGLMRRIEAALKRDVQVARHALREKSARLSTGSAMALQKRNARLETLSARMRALSPVAVLERGYSITYDEKGAILRSTERARPGEYLITRLSDGSITSVVEMKRTKA
ncbi:MAG: exodeoxyribonuclease VII large subunit [Verrucomicrobia bacterium]|nr:exodeoxyribonuclease VII large subunit [Verrucomicrobiota bacterium]